AIEVHFYQLLIDKMDVDVGEVSYPAQFDKEKWRSLRPVFAERFKQKTRDQWCEIFEGEDACFSPVLDMDEAVEYEHNKARGTFVDIAGVQQAAPAPRFSRTACETPQAPKPAGIDNDAVFSSLGLTADQIEGLKSAGVIS
ncbi:MAG: CoA transferase, partial [Pseudomonadales bacterium]|nr:CoA transferase [Pseudomonadales bacterium]